MGIITATVACSPEKSPKPEKLLSEDRYIDLVIELQLVRTYGETHALDSLTVDSLTQEVFNKYEITDSTFVQSHRYYQQFPSEQKNRIEQAIERLKMDQVSENKEDSLNKTQD